MSKHIEETVTYNVHGILKIYRNLLLDLHCRSHQKL